MMFSILFLLMVVGLVMMTGYSLALARNLGIWNQSYRVLGKRYCGKNGSGGVLYGFFFTTPTLYFHYGHNYCQLKSKFSWSQTFIPVTQLIMSWPGRDLQMQIASRDPNFLKTNLPLFKFESSEFSHQFRVAGNQHVDCQKLMSAPVMWHLNQLRTIMAQAKQSPGLNVTIENQQLIITVPGYLKETKPLIQFVDTGLGLFDQLSLAYAQGIEFLQGDEVSIIEDATCPVCSQSIEGEMVVCIRCKTPHCHDCWEYNGHCATFGCGETHFHIIPDCSSHP